MFMFITGNYIFHNNLYSTTLFQDLLSVYVSLHARLLQLGTRKWPLMMITDHTQTMISTRGGMNTFFIHNNACISKWIYSFYPKIIWIYSFSIFQFYIQTVSVRLE